MASLWEVVEEQVDPELAEERGSEELDRGERLADMVVEGGAKMWTESKKKHIAKGLRSLVLYLLDVERHKRFQSEQEAADVQGLLEWARRQTKGRIELPTKEDKVCKRLPKRLLRNWVVTSLERLKPGTVEQYTGALGSLLDYLEVEVPGVDKRGPKQGSGVGAFCWNLLGEALKKSKKNHKTKEGQSL